MSQSNKGIIDRLKTKYKESAEAFELIGRAGILRMSSEMRRWTVIQDSHQQSKPRSLKLFCAAGTEKGSIELLAFYFQIQCQFHRISEIKNHIFCACIDKIGSFV